MLVYFSTAFFYGRKFIPESVAVLWYVYRPFFTYWVTFVQIVCYIVSVAVYGLSPIGFSVKRVESEVFSVMLYCKLTN